MIKRITNGALCLALIGALCLILSTSVFSCKHKQGDPAAGAVGWSAMKEGMTEDQVRAILGEPKSKRTNPMEGTFWEYTEGTRAGMVRFAPRSGRVTHWNVP
ncbi:MAG: outer membrane protein assembly factor BamE domain-containing protein [Phycisphaerae bacterium]